MTTTLRRLWKKENFRIAVMLMLILIILTSFWFALPKALNTGKVFPLFVVVSSSMCIPNEQCSAFSHTFERTLHIGDILVIQGVDAKNLKTNYPDSDIIVFQNPARDTNDPLANIVHRIVDVVEVDGKLYFHTKGDGNNYPNVWPQEPTSPNNMDAWQSNAKDPTSTYNGAISEDYIYGKVIMRIPWIGLIAIQSQKSSIIPIILGILTVLLILFEFVLPAIKKRKIKDKENKDNTTTEQQQTQDNLSNNNNPQQYDNVNTNGTTEEQTIQNNIDNR